MAERAETRPSYLIGRVNRIIKRNIESALVDLDVTVFQYTALSVLSALPGLSNAQLARRSLISPQGMNQALATLVDRGLVTRIAHPTNARVLCVELTKDGSDLLERCDQQVDLVEEKFLQFLDPTQQEALLSGLASLAGIRTDASN